MKTIKQLLLSVFIGGNILLVGVGLFLGHHFITRQLNLLFDAHLVDEAQVVKHIFSESFQEARNANILDSRTDSVEPSKFGLNHLRVQITSQSQNASTVIYSSNMDFPLENKKGFNSFSLHGEEWRSYGQFDQGSQTWVVVADRMANRLQVVECMFTRLGVFLTVGFIILIQVISFAVYYGFKPIRKLAKALREKKADDLSPLSLDHIPQELIPLVTSTNELLHRLKEAFNRESQFSADVAHELRNPLASIRVNLENIIDEFSISSESASHLEHGVMKMQNIVEQMLVLHRIAPDVFMAKFDEVDLSNVVAEVLSQLAGSIQEKRHLISIANSRSVMQGERHSIEILIRNLVVNAIKYCPPESKIHIGLYDYDESVVLEVMDSGPGIPQDERVHIFRRFYRAGGDCHASGVEGCGLGLSIVEKIAKLHKSVVSIGDSIFSSGVSVKVVFPKHIC